MDAEVVEAAVGGSGCCWVRYLTVVAAVGEGPEVAGAEVVLEAAASAAEVEVDLAAVLEVEAVSVAAAPVVVGNKLAGLLGATEF